VLETGKFDAAIAAGSLGPVYANINGTFDCASIPPNGFNFSYGCDPAIDALNDRYLQSFDAPERESIAAEMQRRLNDRVPAIVLYERTFLAAYDARLTGYHPSSFSYWGDPLQLDI
jgi:ABC-type transport system substrate-binding protein